MEDNLYGEPTDSLRSIMRTLWKLEDSLYELTHHEFVNKKQIAYMKKTAKEIDRLTKTLQYVIDLGDD